jgi:hypothetical protein
MAETPPRLNQSETQALKLLQASTRRLQNGAYEMGIPWKINQVSLPMNQGYVKRQMKKMEESIKDQTVKDELDKEMQSCIENGFIEPVPEDEEQAGHGFYMVWFTVVKMARESTKVRIVYNCAQKFGKDKISINDLMHTGPKLQNEIVDILLAWREHEYAVGADISKMFLRFRLAAKDKQYVRLYYKNKAYQFTRWPFGIRASPFAANFGIQQVLATASPETRLLLEKAIYVDDILLSTPDKATAKHVLKETRKLLAAADLPLGKMFATSTDILEDIPEELKADTMKITDKENHSALGMKWNFKKDTIMYDNLEIGDMKWTRPSMAAWTATVYDPHGLIDPIMLEGKLAVQSTYRLPKNLKVEWDTTLTPKLHPDVEKILKAWSKWKGELSNLSKIHIPRCLIKGTPINKQMLAFSDGSSLAYAATFYIRLVYVDSIVTKLIGNKSKLAPLKGRSIPEMELLGAWLAALVGHKFARSLGLMDVHCFYDSLITLARVLKPGQKRGVFATNRITTIVDHTDGWKFGYVPTKENPADIPTRGATVEGLINSENWQNGPSWARMTEDNWPKYEVNITEEDLLGNKTQIVATAISQEGKATSELSTK